MAYSKLVADAMVGFGVSAAAGDMLKNNDAKGLREEIEYKVLATCKTTVDENTAVLKKEFIDEFAHSTNILTTLLKTTNKRSKFLKPFTDENGKKQKVDLVEEIILKLTADTADATSMILEAACDGIWDKNIDPKNALEAAAQFIEINDTRDKMSSKERIRKVFKEYFEDKTDDILNATVDMNNPLLRNSQIMGAYAEAKREKRAITVLDLFDVLVEDITASQVKTFYATRAEEQALDGSKWADDPTKIANVIGTTGKKKTEEKIGAVSARIQPVKSCGSGTINLPEHNWRGYEKLNKRIEATVKSQYNEVQTVGFVMRMAANLFPGMPQLRENEDGSEKKAGGTQPYYRLVRADFDETLFAGNDASKRFLEEAKLRMNTDKVQTLSYQAYLNKAYAANGNNFNDPKLATATALNKYFAYRQSVVIDIMQRAEADIKRDPSLGNNQAYFDRLRQDISELKFAECKGFDKEKQQSVAALLANPDPALQEQITTSAKRDVRTDLLWALDAFENYYNSKKSLSDKKVSYDMARALFDLDGRKFGKNGENDITDEDIEELLTSPDKCGISFNSDKIKELKAGLSSGGRGQVDGGKAYRKLVHVANGFLERKYAERVLLDNVFYGENNEKGKGQ
jgi:hypothetical protein